MRVRKKIKGKEILRATEREREKKREIRGTVGKIEKQRNYK